MELTLPNMTFIILVSGIIECPFCVKKDSQRAHDEAQKPSKVKESIAAQRTTLYQPM